MSSGILSSLTTSSKHRLVVPSSPYARYVELTPNEEVCDGDDSNQLPALLLPAGEKNATVSSSTTARIGMTGIFGGIVSILAAVGLHMWYDADYVHNAGPYPDGWVGYTFQNYIGLMMFTAGMSPGFTLMYVPLSAFNRRANFVQNRIVGGVLTLLLAVLCSVVGLLGMVWGKYNMECLGVFCIDTKKYVEIPNEFAQAGRGFLTTIGNGAFFSLLPIGILLMVRSMKILSTFLLSSTKVDVCETRDVMDSTGAILTASNTHNEQYILQKREEKSVHLSVSGSDHSASRFCAWFLLFVFFVGFGIATTIVPNSWEYFTAPRIAKQAMMDVSADANICNTFWQTVSCPEVPGAVFRTKAYEWSKNFRPKFYPGNVFFYSYIISLTVIVAVIKSTKSGRLFSQKRIGFIPLSIGELCLSVATCGLIVSFGWYWFHDHNFVGYWVGGTDLGIALSDRNARSFGQLAVLMLGLLMFPTSRSSVFHRVFGTSWESTIWIHRVLGYGMLLCVVGHVACWWIKFKEIGIFPAATYQVPIRFHPALDNFTVPVINFCAFFMLICMGIFALEPIRRRFFELFYYTHVVAAYMLIPAVIWHAAAGWEFIIPGVTVWFIDRLIRMYRSAADVTVISVMTHGDVVEIRFAQSSMKVKPGQYVFVNITELSLFEWHPFTVSSSVGSEYFSIHVKSMGEKTWTGRLHRLVSNGHGTMTSPRTFADEERPPFSMGVDGPYGEPVMVTDYNRVIFVAGGIGITPCASLYGSIVGSQLTPTHSTADADCTQQRESKEGKEDTSTWKRDRRIPDVNILWSVRGMDRLQMFEKVLTSPFPTSGTIIPENTTQWEESSRSCGQDSSIVVVGHNDNDEHNQDGRTTGVTNMRTHQEDGREIAADSILNNDEARSSNVSSGSLTNNCAEYMLNADLVGNTVTVCDTTIGRCPMPSTLKWIPASCAERNQFPSLSHEDVVRLCEKQVEEMRSEIASRSASRGKEPGAAEAPSDELTNEEAVSTSSEVQRLIDEDSVQVELYFEELSQYKVKLAQWNEERKRLLLEKDVIPGLNLASGRPCVFEYVQAASKDNQDKSSVLVFCCGPLALIEETRKVASEVGCAFHSETFFL